MTEPMKVIATCTIFLMANIFPMHADAQFLDLVEEESYTSETGFGFESIGGKGGMILKVSNLNKSGEGSLAFALGQIGPRIIVFEVGGIINLEGSSLRIEHPFVTIAGQTAPSPGITIIKGGLQIPTHDVIIQHIRIRPGEVGHTKKSGWEVDGIAANGYRIVIDHCSVSWATDENISPSGPRFEGGNPGEWRKNTAHKVLISNCIIAQGLSNSTHAKGEHSKGSLIHDNATEIAIVKNLYASNMRRNPLFKGGTQGIVVNNYIFNPGRNAIHYHLLPSEWKGHEPVTGKLSVVGNVIEFGKDTQEDMPLGYFQGEVELYWKNNKIIPQTSKTDLTGDHILVDNPPVWPIGLAAISEHQVADQVLKNAGARPWDRDQTDQAIIKEVKKGNNRIIDSETEAGGYPAVPSTFKSFNADRWDMDHITEMTHER